MEKALKLGSIPWSILCAEQESAPGLAELFSSRINTTFPANLAARFCHMTVLTNGLKEVVTHLLPVMSLPEVDPCAPSWLMRRTEVRPGLVERRCGAGICLSHVQAYSDLTQKTEAPSPPPCIHSGLSAGRQQQRWLVSSLADEVHGQP